MAELDVIFLHYARLEKQCNDPNTSSRQSKHPRKALKKENVKARSADIFSSNNTTENVLQLFADQ